MLRFTRGLCVSVAAFRDGSDDAAAGGAGLGRTLDADLLAVARGAVGAHRIDRAARTQAGHRQDGAQFVLRGGPAGGIVGGVQDEGPRALQHRLQPVEVEAEIVTLDCLSSHADWQDTVAWLKHLFRPPAHVFVNHGEAAAQDALAAKILQEFGIAAEPVHALQGGRAILKL